MTTWSSRNLPLPASLPPPSSRPSLQPCPTVRQQWEEEKTREKGHQFPMPSATVMHQHASPHILSSFRLMRCQTLHLEQKSSSPADWCCQSCCSRSKWSELLLCDISDPREGWVLSVPPEGAYRYIRNDCWLQWDMKISFFSSPAALWRRWFHARQAWSI